MQENMSKNLLDEMKEEVREKLLRKASNFAHKSVTYSGSELEEIQRSALQAYLREHGYRHQRGEVPGLSQFISGDVSDALDAVLPRLLSAVEKQPRFLEFESETAGDKQEALMQSLAVESVIRDGQMEPHRMIHDWAKSGLLYRIAIARIQWHKPNMKPFTLENLTTMQLLQVIAKSEEGEEIEIEKVVYKDGHSVEEYPPNGHSYTIAGMRRPKPEIVIQNLPPESLLLPPYTETLDQRNNRGTPYLGVREIISLSLLMDMFPEKHDVLKGLRDEDRDSGNASGSDNSPVIEGGDELFYDPRRTARFYDEQTGEHGGQHGEGDEGAGQTVRFYDEYIRYDLDNDGHAELLNIQRAEKKLLNICEVADNSLAWWSPFPIPNKAIGESLVDKVMEFQDVNTSLVRHGLDATALSINPRIGIDASRVGAADVETADTLDDLLDGGTGVLIRTLGPPKDVIETFTPDPTAAKTAFETWELFKRHREERVGLNPASKGEASSLNRTAAGMAMGQKPGTQYINYIADNFSEGLRIMAIKVRNLLRQGDSQRLKIREGDQIIEVNPLKWQDLKCRVNVAGSLLNHQEKMTFLTMILEQAMKLIDVLGFDNPMVGLKEIRRILVEQAAIMGFRDPEQFFRSISDEQIQVLIENMQNNNPEMQKAQAELQLEQQKASAELEMETRKMEIEQQKAQHELMLKEKSAMADAARKEREMLMKAKLGIMQAELNMFAKLQETAKSKQLESIKMDIESALEARKQDIEAELKKLEIEQKAETEKVTAKIGSVRQGGKVG